MVLILRCSPSMRLKVAPHGRRASLEGRTTASHRSSPVRGAGQSPVGAPPPPGRVGRVPPGIVGIVPPAGRPPPPGPPRPPVLGPAVTIEPV